MPYIFAKQKRPAFFQKTSCRLLGKNKTSGITGYTEISFANAILFCKAKTPRLLSKNVLPHSRQK
jgi:hypothetical protein